MTWKVPSGPLLVTRGDLSRVKTRLNRSEWAMGMAREEIADRYGRNPERLAGVVVALLERLDAIGDDLKFEWVSPRKEVGEPQVARTDVTD